MPSVLLVSHHYPPHIGGLGVVVQKQAESLAENGYQVVVLTSRYGRVRDADRDGTGIHVIGVPCSHILEKVINIPFPLFSVSLIWRAWKLVRAADVVHIHDVFYISSWVAGALAIVLRKPMLVTQHVAMVDHSSRLVMLVQRLVYATFGRLLFAKARKVVVYNQNVQSFLRSMGVPQDRILFLSNGIDTAVFRPAAHEERAAIRQRYGLPLGRPLVLFVGRLVEKKGYQILFAARDPEYDLVFVGPGAIPRDGQGEGVHWIGPLDQAQTAELFRACDLFAFPAVGEIFTLVMQEAMASGLPVVTTDDPAYIGSMVSGVVVLCRRDADSFKNRIKDLFADRAGLLNLSAQSRQLAVRYFDWRSNSSRLLDAFSDVLYKGA
jgi:D-inositol-3-phosphate glycosyltransferase